MLIKKIPDVSGLVITTVLNTKTKEVGNKILDKKTDYDGKISDIEKKYSATSDSNKFTSDILDAKIKEKELVNKSGISYLIKNFDLSTKITALATKAELKAEQDKIVNLEMF